MGIYTEGDRMKNILITGASRGIGRAIAKEFAQTDCNLFVNSLHGGEKLTECVDELTSIRRGRAGTGCIVALKGDVGDPEFVRSMFAEIKRHTQSFDGAMKSDANGPARIDILINNSGI